jgi:DNA processing protein
MTGENQKYMSFWIGTVPGIGIVKAKRLVERAGSLERLYRMTEKEIRALSAVSEKDVSELLACRKEETLEMKYRQMEAKGIRYLSFFDSGYPEKLRRVDNPPLRLYVKGELPPENRTAIGIVGSRDCTAYGRDMARLFGFRLAQAGVSVISGMALGVDGWSHQGALEGGGKTFAVLGSGVDICYPMAHARLYESIGRRGGILSEYHPGMKAKPQFFPLRNRIISGLADGILLVEARQESGSLITVEAALEQGKDVFVIPGRIGDELSVGCNRLIVQGALPVLSPDDILDYYHLTDRQQSSSEKKENETGDTLENLLYARLQKKPAHVDALCAEMGKTATNVMKCLIKLKKEGKIKELSRGFFASL